jgi:hypothetical protein
MAKQLTSDEALEQTRVRSLTNRVGYDTLPEDNDRPAAPANNLYVPRVPEDHPSRDRDLDVGEVYEESEEGIAYSPKKPPFEAAINNDLSIKEGSWDE